MQETNDFLRTLGLLNGCFFICFSVLQKNETKSPDSTAAAIPAEPAHNGPVRTPSKPFSRIASLVPFTRTLPKPVSGTVAPAPAKSTSLSYTPVAPRITPSTTKVTSILAGVIFVTSISICPITHMSPPTKKRFKKNQQKNISPSDFRNYFVPIFNNYSFRKSNPPGKSSESVCTSYSPLPSPRIILKSPPQNSSIT